MRITTRGRYALRSALALARLSKNGETVSITSLSEAEDISPIFLEQIFFNLKKHGIVKSVRGPGGGFAFNRPLETLSVRDILNAAGEELDVLPCDRHLKECNRINECNAHKTIVAISTMVNNYMSNLTIKMLLEDKDFCFPH